MTDPSGTSCEATQTITVNQLPTVNPALNTITCSSAILPPVNFTGSNATSYQWTNTNTQIGLAASGTGNIASFVSQNSTTSPQTAVISVTPVNTANGVSCQGTAQNFTITVNPIPVVAAIPNQSLCQGASSSAVSFVGSISGSTFSWTNSNATIGLAASGTGNIASFVGQN